MNFIYKKNIILVFSFLISIKTLNAQFSFNLSEYEVGIMAGGLVSRTALTVDNKFGSYKQMHPAVSFFAQKPLAGPFYLRTSLMIGQIGYDDSKVNTPGYSWLQLRNFKYKTTMAELSTMIVLNLVKEKYNLFSHEHRHRFTPYIFGGIGFSYVNVKPDWSKIDSAYLTNTPYLDGLALDTLPGRIPKMIAVFPIGGGLRYAIDPQLAIFGEANLRYNFEHYLDGFNYSTGRSNSKDFFYGISIGVSFRPISKDYRNNCPERVF